MQDDERHRLVAWLAAEFEVQNGIDVSRDTNVIARLQQTAEHAAAAPDKYEVNLPFLAADETGPKHLHVVLEKKRIDDIRAGREGPPHVDRPRRPDPMTLSELRKSNPPPPKSDSSRRWVLAALVFILGTAITLVYEASTSTTKHHDHDGHGQEHKR